MSGSRLISGRYCNWHNVALFSLAVHGKEG